jgi:hypothetical protein
MGAAAGELSAVTKRQPLFVNLTSDDAHRSQMAQSLDVGQQKLEHPVTIYQNDRAVLLPTRSRSQAFKVQQDCLTALHRDRAQILICPMFMKHFGVSQADLIPGVQLSNPRLSGKALFQPGTQALSR